MCDCTRCADAAFGPIEMRVSSLDFDQYVRVHLLQLLRSATRGQHGGAVPEQRLPALPPKTSFGVRRFGQDFCEGRRAALERYMRGLVELVPNVVLNPDLLEFLELL